MRTVEAVLATASASGRDAEVFAYDYNSGDLSLEPADDAVAASAAVGRT